MEAQDSAVNKVNDCIQTKMKEKSLENVTPVEATRWLVEAGLREKIESRPGIYLRSLCRKGKITGAEKTNNSWIIHRV